MRDAAPSPRRTTRDWHGSKTLVIGCGFIGSNVVAEIAGRGEPPRVLTHRAPAAAIVAALGEERLLLGDAAEQATVEGALEGIEHVAFCAGGLLPAASEADPERDRELTLKPLRTVLAALRERPGVSLLYLSSGGTVYGQPQRLPVSEDDPTDPVSAYGTLHLACEREILDAAAETGMPVRILRCATVYGEQQRPERGQGAIVTFLHRIEQGETLDLYGGGTTIRDYIYVGDVARAAIALMALEGGPEVLNVGSGEGTTLIEILRLAEAQTGRSAKIDQHPERSFDVHQIVLDTTRLHSAIELEITPLREGIERTHRWLQEAA